MAVKVLDQSSGGTSPFFYGSANISADSRNGEVGNKSVKPDGSNLS